MNKNILLSGLALALFVGGFVFFANSGARNASALEAEALNNTVEKPAACQQLIKDGSCGCTANGGTCGCGQNGSTCGAAKAASSDRTTKTACGCQANR